ncbi:PREDICTED: probable LRR receptor-like serine/threonine-protein kinase At5g59680 isoform X2 [Tarenaya hassleriana]|uniref:probable LRR receptor-like serine/threonine-protein kinase At5g59680 isoform X2 n=1 Tax=Tarenaya hassleriana TaxID=28532 RepID=UPI00053C35F5|nr:PREDICTED: probable LRR receptor-like serine/threonine-protein kinase At5g59680 isoform X2 [Tarenaya hassleriana]
MQSLSGFLLALVSFLAVIYAARAQDQQGFISLDCGLPTSESPYIEPSTGLTFSSDSDFVQSGKTGRIQENLRSDYLRPYTTLRYFPDGTRNCYNLSVTKNTNYLIRAMFRYGNYDGLNSNPKFDLYLGPNNWTSVDLERRAREEIIHIVRSNTLQICLVKTGSSTPFISSLELRPLRNDTYITKSGSLKLFARNYLRPPDKSIRFRNDIHDRIWTSYFLSGWRQINTTLNVNASNGYNPPQSALATAATPTNASAPLIMLWLLDSRDDEVYFYLHFSEIQDLGSNDTREFAISLNLNSSNTVLSPQKLQINTIYSTYASKCFIGICTLQLIRTARSTLPPLLNAVELYTIIQFPQPETDQNDVAAVKNIKETYRLSKISWQGDPCVPQNFSWDGLKCNFSDISTPPRIISLNLSSSGLNGTILSGIKELTELQMLDLSNNSLTGEVPEFLANIKSLTVVNLSRNNLSGAVPHALLDRQKKGLKLILDGNPKLCNSTSCKGHDKKKFVVPVVASVTSVAAIAVVLFLVFVFRKKKASVVEEPKPASGLLVTEARSNNRPTHSPIVRKKRRFTYAEVIEMTDNFERVLGKGGFGVVFHGCLDHNEQVAVKMLSHSSAQGLKEFKAEVELLLRVHHINLVSLVGYCDEGDRMALVYEYMPKGDLRQHLSGKRGGFVLSWETRLRIAVDAALGLEYLHVGCTPAMVHRDVKSTNILLDDRFHAKLSDFGLSRSFPVGTKTHVSTVVAGTPGYLDPGYFGTNRLTEKSDVYGFGVVLLEVMTNRPVIEQAREKTHIKDWVASRLTRGDIGNIMDPNLRGDYETGSVWKAVELAMSCLNPSSRERPTMSRVVQELKEYLKSERSRRGDTKAKSSVELSVEFTTEVFPRAR